MTQLEYDTTMNPILKTALWILGVLALAWVFLIAGMMGRMGPVAGSPMMGRGAMMGGGMMGMMLVMTFTWLIMLGLVGVLIYLIVVAVRSRRAA